LIINRLRDFDLVDGFSFAMRFAMQNEDICLIRVFKHKLPFFLCAHNSYTTLLNKVGGEDIAIIRLAIGNSIPLITENYLASFDDEHGLILSKLRAQHTGFMRNQKIKSAIFIQFQCRRGAYLPVDRFFLC